MIILDTSALYAFLRADDPMSLTVQAALQGEPVVVVSPYVLAEIDYLVMSRFGVTAELRMLEELASGAYDLAVMGSSDLLACTRVIEQFADQRVGLADASIVVLAERYGTHRIATLDRRHFSVLRALDGRPFDLLP